VAAWVVVGLCLGSGFALVVGSLFVLQHIASKDGSARPRTYVRCGLVASAGVASLERR
jgi:hypothetical protein